MSTMAANRDERFLMRQRGAGTRDINLTFDLQLPGVPTISRSPMRPPKPGRSQPDLPNLKATRQTPKLKKATPRLVAKRTLATANNATPRTAVRGDNVERPAISKHSSVSEAPQQVSQGISAQKRKIDLNLAEGTTEDPELPPTKRRKKRKSIGQNSTRKKARAPPLAKKTIQDSKQSNKTKEVEEVPPEPMELVPEKNPQASEIPSDSKTMQHPAQALGVAQVTKEPKRRKRKSIGQIQKPKKTPKLAGQATVHARSDDVEQQQIPIVADASVEERSQTVEKPKPQRCKPNAVTESSKRRKSPMQRMPSPHFATHIPDVLRGELIPDRCIGNIVAAEQPKRRGRKPNATVKDKIDNPKEVSNLPMAVLDIQGQEGEPPQLGEAVPEADEASAVLKQTRKKRKPIGQIQKLRKKTATRPLRAIDPNLNFVSDEIAMDRRTATAISPPIPQGRSLSDNPQLSSPNKEKAQVFPEYQFFVQAPAPNKRDRPKKAQAAPLEHSTEFAPAQIEPEHEAPMPAPATKKRGRPKKAETAPQEHLSVEPAQRELGSGILPPALTTKKRGQPRKAQSDPQAAEIAEIERMHPEAEPAKEPERRRGPMQRLASANETTPFEASQPVNRDAVPTQPRRRRAKNVSRLNVQENGREAMPEVQDAPSAELELRVLSPAPVKKRGRPKKQVADPLLAEDAARKNPTSQLRKPKHQSRVAPPKLPPATGPRSRAKPFTALPVQDDVDEDPLSECTPLQLTHKAKVNPIKLRTQLHPQVTSHPSYKPEVTVSDHSDLNEAPVLKVTKRRAEALNKQLIPREQEDGVVAHPLARQSQGSPGLESANSSPGLQHQHNRAADLDSHIEQSLLEENALKADLEELQAQRAQEIEEQKERDLTMQLERLSASVKKKQADNDPHKVHQDEPILGVKKKAKGLENLFRTVSGTRKGSGGDIDPDLQGILDQVKGVGRGGGGIMKIF
ncbi:MAG: hypothetical protein L6R42_006442 [Xanthoria sp. 1 TBL-2021]|nr:MAG: hypothetical protein L6R42_006442 [Xanthoria sp. 1 TBL-2021]